MDGWMRGGVHLSLSLTHLSVSSPYTQSDIHDRAIVSLLLHKLADWPRARAAAEEAKAAKAAERKAGKKGGGGGSGGGEGG